MSVRVFVAAAPAILVSSLRLGFLRSQPVISTLGTLPSHALSTRSAGRKKKRKENLFGVLPLRLSSLASSCHGAELVLVICEIVFTDMFQSSMFERSNAVNQTP